VSPTEESCIRQTLAVILEGCPRVILLACLESLGYGSGELFDAAMQTVRGFLAEGEEPQRRNGKAAAAREGGSWILKAVEGDAKLLEWLAAAVQAMRGADSARGEWKEELFPFWEWAREQKHSHLEPVL
jgi:hypothetical protein